MPKYEYLSGFGNHFSSEALPNTLPVGQNSPQKCPAGLYAEQLSGTAFTVPRKSNFRSWLYRIRPSVCHLPFKPIDNGLICNDFTSQKPTPNQLRWKPLTIPPSSQPTDFVQGIITFAGSGSPQTKQGLSINMYAANISMQDKAFYNSDGDLLIVPQQGTLDIRTEFGLLEVASGEICVIPRGILFSVALQEPSRGYILEIFSGHFTIPDLGPIGANGLANPRDFLAPVAAFEEREVEYTIVNKFQGHLFEAKKIIPLLT